MSEEEHIWSGNPSQLVNIKSFILLGLFFWLVIPLFFMLWKWLTVKYTKYELTTQQLKTSTGIINKKVDVLELYRVLDYRLEQPFFLRLFSLGSITLVATDESDPTIILTAISNSEEILAKLRKQVEECRKEKGAREFYVR